MRVITGSNAENCCRDDQYICRCCIMDIFEILHCEHFATFDLSKEKQCERRWSAESWVFIL